MAVWEMVSCLLIERYTCRGTYNSDGLFWASDSDSDGNRAIGALRPGRASR